MIRPLEVLHTVSVAFPNAWRDFDNFRAGRGKGDLPEWPVWCWCPLAAAFAIASGGGQNLPLERKLLAAEWVGRLGALGAWRPGQGVYRYDPDVFQAVADTEMDRAVPWETLYRLPEWCVYIETLGLRWNGQLAHGFFAHLEWDATTGRTELRLVVDLPRGLESIPIHFAEGGTLLDGLEDTLREAQIQAPTNFQVPTAAQIPAKDLAVLRAMVSLTLYLCADNADLGGSPVKAEPIKTRHGLKTFPPNQPRIWEVGVRMGAALRGALSNERAEGQGGSHASPRPHLRRAHWHGYWTGPRKGDQRLEMRWILPILVGKGEAPAVIHRVEE